MAAQTAAAPDEPLKNSYSERPVLITIPVSHFCEKARWALDRFNIPYDEQPHCPGFHVPAVKAAGGKGSSTPLLARLLKNRKNLV